MKKYVRFCIYGFSVFVLLNICISSSAQDKSFFLKPKCLSFDFNGNGMWQINEGFKGQWIDELRLRGQQRGLATLCIGGGQGAALLLEVK